MADKRALQLCPCYEPALALFCWQRTSCIPAYLSGSSLSAFLAFYVNSRCGLLVSQL